MKDGEEVLVLRADTDPNLTYLVPKLNTLVSTASWYYYYRTQGRSSRACDNITAVRFACASVAVSRLRHQCKVGSGRSPEII